MLDTVLNAIVAALEAQGVSALRQYPSTALNPAFGPVVCVGLKSNKLVSAGAGDYMGEKTVGGVTSEVFGFRMEPVIALDVYSPDDGGHGAIGCTVCAAEVAAALSAFPKALKPKALVCGEPCYDAQTDMFRMVLELSCCAFLTRERNADTGVFTDFTLRGVLK
ncbi:MAG: hypothetical protein RR314_04705 [Oscillospiraceae bacterium]